MPLSRKQVEEGRRQNEERRAKRRIRAKATTPLTPEQVARRLKLEQQRAKAEERARTFKLMCRGAGLPMPTREHYFAPPRKWRVDFAWEPEKVALEVEGGAWSGGRHTRGSGYLLDMEKYNELALRGWVLLRTVPSQLCAEATIEMAKRALSQRSEAA